jgi:hypothetical protein
MSMLTRHSHAENPKTRSVAGVLRLGTLTACVVTSSVLAAAGCSSHSSNTHQQVASVATAAASSSSAAGDVGVEIRPDWTDVDVQAANRAYYACLKTHGVPMFAKPGGYEVPADDEKPAAAYEACKVKKPYLSPLLDKNKNPNWGDQTRAWMACMNRQGIPVSGDPYADFFTFGTRRADIDSAKYVEIYRQCQKESYK